MKHDLLEELEGLDRPSAVGEEQAQVVLSYSFPGQTERDGVTA